MTSTLEHSEETLREMADLARRALDEPKFADADIRAEAVRAVASALRRDAAVILRENQRDLAAIRQSGAFRDRLLLTSERIQAMALGVEAIAQLPDPLARDLGEWTRPNGLRIRRVPQPIGVIGMVYESRPNVGAEAAALCLKSGNAVILRGGSESFRSATAIQSAVAAGIRAVGLPVALVQSAPDSGREFVAAMLAAAGLIDLLIPRGGKSLVERVERDARVPVLAHAAGLCHTYVHRDADPVMARRVLANAKMRRPGICSATETLLIDASVAGSLLPPIIADLRALGCECRLDERAHAILPDLPRATAQDFDTEWLDSVLSVAVVDGLDAAIAHIKRHGSGHTDAIITENAAAAQTFLARSGSAVTLWNASTQFCDGGEFGFGAEIGIATGTLHARGPVGLEQLTTYRYVVFGAGQVRR